MPNAALNARVKWAWSAKPAASAVSARGPRLAQPAPGHVEAPHHRVPRNQARLVVGDSWWDLWPWLCQWPVTQSGRMSRAAGIVARREGSLRRRGHGRRALAGLEL